MPNTPSCINLKERFGAQYKVTYEESYYAERSRHTLVDPWLMIIPCQHGHIYPQGGDLLAVSTDKRGGIARQVIGSPFVTVEQDGTDGINATFPVERFDEVAAIVKPKRRRRLSAERRERLAEMGKVNLQRHREAKAQTPQNDPERAQGGQEDSEHQIDPAA